MESKALEKCLSTLKKSESDTEKFAALLLVTKVIKAEECTSETRREVFDAIGFQFLRRLMKTGKTPEGCPDYSFKNLAIIILHSFCSDPELAQSAEMHKCLPQLNSLVSHVIDRGLEEGDVAAQEAMVKECYDSLVCIASSIQGREAMIKYRTVTALCHACVEKSYAHEHAEHLLHHLLLHNKYNLWDGNTDGFKVLVTHLVNQFSKKNAEDVFEQCVKLETVISSLDKRHLNDNNHEQWMSKAHQTLSNLLKSKLGKTQRNHAIRLASVLVNLLGIEWAVGETDESRKFLLILVHLACVEVRMLLEIDLKLDQVQSAETGCLLSSLYLLLENIISYLASGPSLRLEDRQVQQLHAAMVGAFGAVLFFLSEVATKHKDKSQHPVVVASVRVLGAWMAEETTALSADVYQILPFLINVGRESFYAVRKSRQASKSRENGASNGAASITENLESLKLEAESRLPGGSADGGDQNLGGPAGSAGPGELDVLRFMLPGLCHITAEETARNILKQNGIHELLGEYFTYQWGMYQASLQTPESWIPVATLCGIFLNLVILDSKSLADHIVFTELLEFAVCTLPTLVKSSVELTLSFNIAVVGLLLYRYIGDKHDMPRGDCDKFFNAVISLLRRAHQTQISIDGELQLAIAEAYRLEWSAISELWFLGMQALSECIAIYPSLSSCLLSSGWISLLLKSLRELKGQKLTPELSQIFQTLFSSLATSNVKAKQVILEKGGREVALTYKMKELKKALQIK